MAISKNDCLILLSELSANGIDTTEQTKFLIKNSEPTLDILKFINDNRQLDLTNFYEKIRKSYNSGKSKLYKNLMSEIDEANPTEVLTTLNAYSLQILLFSKNLENKQLFFRFARLEEVYKCLLFYSKTYDLTPCIELISIIRSDIKTLETVYRHKK